MDRTFSKPLVILCLILFSLLIGLERWHTYDEPQERDVSTWALIGHEMGKGRVLYVDLWEIKPPAIHVTYWAAEKLFGYGSFEIYALGVIAAVGTLLGVFATGSIFGTTAGFLAALGWTMVCSDMLLQANQPNVEVFMNFCLVWAFFFLIRPNGGWGHALLSGVLLGIGVIYKPQILVFIPLFTIALLWRRHQLRKPWAWIQTGSLLLTPSLILVSICCAYFAGMGHWNDFYTEVFIYSRYYGGDLVSNLIDGLRLEKFFPVCVSFLFPLILVIVVAVLMGFRKRPKEWGAYFCFAIGTYMIVSVTGHFHPHYYQLWLPLLMIGAGWSVGPLIDEPDPRFRGKYGLAIVIWGWLAGHEIPTYFLSSEQWSIEKYGRQFVDARLIGNWLSTLLVGKEKFFAFTDNTTLYFAAREDPPSRMLYVDPLFNGPDHDLLQRQVFGELERNKTDLMVINYDIPKDLLLSLLKNYRPYSNYRSLGYKLLVRKDSDLEKRILLAMSVEGQPLPAHR